LVTDAVLIRRRIQRVRSLLNDATLARPTNWQLSRCGCTGGPPRPAPLTHWELITVQWNYSVTDSQPTRSLPAGGFAYWPSLKQLFITLLDSEKFNARYREIFSSLESR